jgi:hypothetical protein
VKLHGSSAACCEGDSLDGHLIFRHRQLAGVARLPVARSTIDPRDAITRKTAALELVHDEGVESFFVQWRRPLGVAASLDARFTRSWCPEAPTRKAEVQAGYAAT